MHELGDPTRRSAGQHARAMVLRLRLRTLLALGVVAVATGLLGRAFGFGLHDVFFMLSELALLATMFVVSHYVLPLVDRRDRGASAEEHVGAILDQLDRREWCVIHDASLGRGNMDHIVIGRAGVFSVETKSHPGPVHVRRLHGDTLRQALAQRKTLERITGLQVESLLVFSRARVDRPLARRKEVRVLPARMLPTYLGRCRPSLTAEQVSEAQARLVQALTEHCARSDRLATRAAAGSRLW